MSGRFEQAAAATKYYGIARHKPTGMALFIVA
jgi:hypothetical protein